MGRIIKVFVLLFVLSSCSTSTSTSFISIEGAPFNRDGFITIGEAEWNFDKGNINCSRGEGFIQTKERYTYFRLSLEFLADETINSGIFFSCKGDEISATACYEANIWDNHPNQSYRTGSLVTRAEPLEVVNTLNKWSKYEILAEREIIRIWINGIQTVELSIQGLESGHIAFQKFGSGQLNFRNIMIEPLK